MNAFLGLEMRHETLLTVYAQHNEDFAKQVYAGLRRDSTYHKYCTVYKHLEEFIKKRYLTLVHMKMVLSQCQYWILNKLVYNWMVNGSISNRCNCSNFIASIFR